MQQKSTYTWKIHLSIIKMHSVSLIDVQKSFLCRHSAISLFLYFFYFIISKAYVLICYEFVRRIFGKIIKVSGKNLNNKYGWNRIVIAMKLLWYLNLVCKNRVISFKNSHNLRNCLQARVVRQKNFVSKSIVSNTIYMYDDSYQFISISNINFTIILTQRHGLSSFQLT